MEASDAIVVVPTLLLVAIVTVYALMASYAGLFLYEQTCKKCGETMPTEEALRAHMEAHKQVQEGSEAKLLDYPSVETGKSAA
ncbi:MAG: hypothetical protein IME99_10210 [Proteobacteria bacterium]|nr:hypothetical protein [Pseudomonadota bacterium]